MNLLVYLIGGLVTGAVIETFCHNQVYEILLICIPIILGVIIIERFGRNL